MFIEPLLQVGTLHVMKAARIASVMARENSSLLIYFAAERVATAFGKHLETTRLWMIPPNLLAHGVRDWLLIQPGAHHIGRHSAALAPIKPAVRSPSQAIDHRMCVLQTKTRQYDL